MDTDTIDVRWLFESGVFEDGNPQRLARAARARGMRTAEAMFVPAGKSDADLRPVKLVPFAADEPDVALRHTLGL